MGAGRLFSVAEEVQRALAASRYFALRAIRCQYHEGVVTLRGRAPTFYLKQLAQTIVLRIPGVEEVVNRIQVDSPDE